MCVHGCIYSLAVYHVGIICIEVIRTQFITKYGDFFFLTDYTVNWGSWMADKIPMVGWLAKNGGKVHSLTALHSWRELRPSK